MQEINIFLLLAIFLPALYFIYIGLSKVSKTTELAEFYHLSGHAKQSDYTQSTIAYMLQTATTFYFIYWGYNYGFANIFYILSWLGGIFVFMAFSRPLALWFRKHFSTLPQLIGSSTSPPLRILATIVSILGFAAIVYIETYYASMFGSEVVRSTDETVSSSLKWIFFLTFISVSFLYSVFGGIAKVYFTDRIQLGLAYFGFCLVFSYLIVRSFESNPSSAMVLAAMILCVLVFLLIEDIRCRNFSAKFKLLFAGICIFSTFVFQAVLDADFGVASNAPVIPGMLSQLKESYGWVTLLGFTILNLGWQFCDNSNYQRIVSIESNSKDTEKELVRKVRAAIRSTLFASPLTWAFGIFLGMLIRTSGIVVTVPGTEAVSFIIDLHMLATQGEILPLIGLAGFAIAISSIMLSTVDSSVLSIMQMWEVDLAARKETQLWFRLVIAGILFAIVTLMYHVAEQESILVIVNYAYSQLFVLSIPAIVRLMRIKVTTQEIAASIILGSVFAFWAAFYAPESLNYNIAIVLPTLACLVGSTLPLVVRLTKRELVS